jgi:hypothetical protein
VRRLSEKRAVKGGINVFGKEDLISGTILKNI